jgi:hypothetical protein
MYPDAAIVEADSPGDIPPGKLMEAAVGRALLALKNLSRPLFTMFRVQRLMGSPLRLVEREERERPAEASKAWV